MQILSTKCISITYEEVKEEVVKLKSSKAMEPDDISSVMIKKLVDKGSKLLTQLFNVLLNTHTTSYPKDGRSPG